MTYRILSVMKESSATKYHLQTFDGINSCRTETLESWNLFIMIKCVVIKEILGLTQFAVIGGAAWTFLVVVPVCLQAQDPGLWEIADTFFGAWQNSPIRISNEVSPPLFLGF